jgi:succinate dehydrogenase/fumarate reductase flavoprotein subunit
MEKYNHIAMDHSLQPDEFGKSVFPTTFNINETLHVAQITPSIHYTMGGIRINKNAQVLNEKNEPIEGLFAAGEVTGGVHGKNRLAGNSLLECVVFGRIAGRVNYI